MATLVLTNVGSIIGGPIGGAIGAIIGQQIDQAIFAPSGRQGPRLNDLAAQTSSYGTRIPKIYGTMRAAGTVIWATDLIEHSSTSGGKGAPKVTTYTYTASFAVVLSARAIRGVGRIWADGKLFKGAGGDFKTKTGYRLYLGSEGQAVDPVIASAEGIGDTPAYRGHAYAVFQDMELDSYGNRIPSLSFEVFADDGDVTLEQVVTDLNGAAVIADCPTRFGGYAASGDSVRGAIETLTAAVPVRVSDDGRTLSLVETVEPVRAVAAKALGSAADSARTEKFALSRKSASSISQTLVLSYYDAARDYQQGSQQARREGGARKDDQLNLPVTLTPSVAKTLVEQRLSTSWTERATAKIKLPWRYLDIHPGDNVLVPGSADIWRVSAISFTRMVLTVDLVRTAQPVPLTLVADAGRNVSQTDLPAGPTTLALLDLPQLSDGVATAPLVMAAAAGVSPAWRSAALLQSIDGGLSWQSGGQTALPAIMGSALSLLPAASATLIDALSSVDVQLLHADMALGDASDDLLLGGANAAMLGGELIQFGRALALGGGVYRLSRLLRGQRGTEDRMAGHSSGERFVLLDSHTLATLTIPAGVAQLRVTAQGVGDTSAAAQTEIAVSALALRPPSPVMLTANRQVNGDMLITWIRRSRDGWRWVDGVEAPLAEQQELYAFTLNPPNGAVREVQLTTPSFLYAAAQIATDKAAGASAITVSVRQIGTMQTSLATTLTVSLT